MKSQIEVSPKVERLVKYLSWIEEGVFKIPSFQRDFVWENKEKIELFDSISKEYPIGSILLWQPKDQYRNKLEIGPYKIKDSNSPMSFYILDGFQRLSTLFGCLTNPQKTKLDVDSTILKKYFLCYDLEEESFNMNQAESATNIPVYKLIDTFEYLDFIDNLRHRINDSEKSNILIDRAKKLSSTLIDYKIPSTEIFGGSIKDAVDIFSRVNSKGITISPDWMLSALTSRENENFNLGELLGQLKVELSTYNFGKISRDVLVQCITSSFGKIFFDQKIEELAKRSDFQSVTYRVLDGIKKAVKFLFEELLVIDKRLLPYNNQLIFLTVFFTKIDTPSERQKDKLKSWFWITSYSNYYTIYSLSKIRQSFEQFKRFINNENENPVYYDKPNQKFSVADLPNLVSAKSVRSTTYLLFLLNYSNTFNHAAFRRIDSTTIDCLKVSYLFGNKTTHDNVFPMIKYFSPQLDSFNDMFIEKNIDLSFIFSKHDFIDHAELYFLTKEMQDIYNSELDMLVKEKMILEKRFKYIKETEKGFVNNLNILYEI